MQARAETEQALQKAGRSVRAARNRCRRRKIERRFNLKIAVLGAGGVRTPLIVGAMLRRRERLGLTELALMDVDADRLDIIGELAQAEQEQPTVSAGTGQAAGFKIDCTTDAPRRAGRR